MAVTCVHTHLFETALPGRCVVLKRAAQRVAPELVPGLARLGALLQSHTLQMLKEAASEKSDGGLRLERAEGASREQRVGARVRGRGRGVAEREHTHEAHRSCTCAA